MSDEEVDLDEIAPIEIDVDPSPALDVELVSLSPIDVDVEAVAELAAELSQAAPIDVQPAQVPPIDVETDSPDPVDVIVGLIMGLTAEQFDRLNAAITDLEVNPYKVFSAAWPKCTGDATAITLTSTYKQVAYGIIPRDAWRDSGVLHVHARVRVTDAMGTGSGSVYFSLESAPMPVAGVYQVYTQHMEQSVVISSDGVTPSVFNATLVCDIDVGGSTSDAWEQNATGIVHGWVVGTKTPNSVNQPFNPVYDPTEKRFFRLQVKYVSSAGTVTPVWRSASCWLTNPRDGTCHAL